MSCYIASTACRGINSPGTGDVEAIRGKPGPKLSGVGPVLKYLLSRSIIVDIDFKIVARAHPIPFPSGLFRVAHKRPLRGAEIDRPTGIDRPSTTRRPPPKTPPGFGWADVEQRAPA